MVMKKATVKDALRTVVRTKYRYISILCIVALGVGFFAGVKASSPDMIRSTDIYSDRQDLMHFRVLSTWGFDGDDVKKLASLAGARIQPSYFYDCMAAADGRELETRFEAFDKENEINRPELKSGRYPTSDDECLVDSASSLKPGAVITVTTAGAGEQLKNTSFKVVGSFYSAMYISDYERGTTQVGSGALSRVVYIAPSNFKSEYHTQIYVAYEDMKQAVVYTDGYKKLEAEKEEQIEELSETAVKERYEKTVKESNEKLAEAEKEISENENKLADAAKELSDGEEKIKDGAEKLAEAEKLLEEKRVELSEAEQKISDGEAELRKMTEDAANASTALIEAHRAYDQGYEEYAEAKLAAEKELSNARHEIEKAEMQLSEAKPELDSAWETYGSLCGFYDKAYGYYEEAKERYDGICEAINADPEQKTLLKDQLDKAYTAFMKIKEYLDSSKAELDEKQAEYDKYAAELDGAKKKLKKSEKEADKKLGEAKAKLDDAKAQIEYNENLMLNGAVLLADAKKELEQGKEQLEEGRKQFEEGEAELSEKRKELDDAISEFEKGKAEYEDGVKKLDEARIELEDGRKRISELKEPVWYVFTRDDNAGYAEYGENAERIENISKVFPAFFILVAALVCMTGMTRMVEEERTQIGTMKALGYTTGRILGKYMFYCLSATFLGCAVGLATGYKVFPFAIQKAYGMLYRIRVTYMPFIFTDAAVITAFSLILASVTVTLCCYKVMRPMPAKLMRAEAPKSGKRVLLERIGFIWNRLSFFTKVSVRNIFRYKKRMIMTLIGIMGCTALVLCGFALRDSISDIVGKHFDTVICYDAFAAIDGPDEQYREKIGEILKGYDENASEMLAMQKTEDISANGGKYQGYVYVVESAEAADKMINFRNRITKEEYTLEKGSVLITEKLAALLGVGVGDSVSLGTGAGVEGTVTISGVVENYISHFVYMLPETYEEAVGEFDFNLIVLSYDVSKEAETAMMSEINALDRIVMVQTQTQIKETFSRMMQAFNAVVLVLIISAMLLAVIVLYNLASINIAERKREIATLEVLGFNDAEVSQYIFRESIALTLTGTLIGLGLGRLLADYVIKTAEIDLVMFGRDIHPLSYVFAAALTVLFSLAVDLYMNRPIRKISMVESLKSVD